MTPRSARTSKVALRRMGWSPFGFPGWRKHAEKVAAEVSEDIEYLRGILFEESPAHTPNAASDEQQSYGDASDRVREWAWSAGRAAAPPLVTTRPSLASVIHLLQEDISPSSPAGESLVMALVERLGQLVERDHASKFDPEKARFFITGALSEEGRAWDVIVEASAAEGFQPASRYLGMLVGDAGAGDVQAIRRFVALAHDAYEREHLLKKPRVYKRPRPSRGSQEEEVMSKVAAEIQLRLNETLKSARLRERYSPSEIAANIAALEAGRFIEPAVKSSRVELPIERFLREAKAHDGPAWDAFRAFSAAVGQTDAEAHLEEVAERFAEASTVEATLLMALALAQADEDNESERRQRGRREESQHRLRAARDDD